MFTRHAIPGKLPSISNAPPPPSLEQKTALLNSALNFLTAPVTGGGGGGGGGADGTDGRGGGGGRMKVEELRRLTGHVMR